MTFTKKDLQILSIFIGINLIVALFIKLVWDMSLFAALSAGAVGSFLVYKRKSNADRQ